MSDAGRIVAGGAAVRLTANLDEVRAALAALPRMMSEAGAKSVRGIGPHLAAVQKQIEAVVKAAASAATGLGDPLAVAFGRRMAAAKMGAAGPEPAYGGKWEGGMAGAAMQRSEIAAAAGRLAAGEAEGLKEQASAASASGMALKAYRKDVQAAAAANAEFRSSMMSVGMAGAMLAAAGGAVVYAMVRWSREAAGASLALLNMASKTGLTTDQLQKLQYAGLMTNVSAEELDSGIRRLNLVIKQAGDGGKEANAALGDLGLTFDDLEGKDVYGRLLLVADGLVKVSDDSQRAGTAIQIFGRTGANMLPMLAGGAEHLRALGDAAERYGIIIEQDVLQANAKLAREQAILGKQWDAAKMQVAGALGPMLISVAQAAGRAATEFGRFAAAHPQAMRLVLILAGVALAAGTVAAGFATAAWAAGVLASAALKIGAVVTVLKAVAAAGAVAAGGMAPLLITIGLIVAAAVAAAMVLDALYAKKAKKAGPARSEEESAQDLARAEERLRVVREVVQVERDSAYEVARIKAQLIENGYMRERALINAEAEHKAAALQGQGLAAEIIQARLAAIESERAAKLDALERKLARERFEKMGKLYDELASARGKAATARDEFGGKWSELLADQAKRRGEVGPEGLGVFAQVAAQEQSNLAWEFHRRFSQAREDAERRLGEVRNEATRSWYEREVKAIDARYGQEIGAARKAAKQMAELARREPGKADLGVAADDARKVVERLEEAQRAAQANLKARRAEREAEARSRLDEELSVLRARTRLEGRALVERLRALALEKELREANERAIGAGRKGADAEETKRIREKHALKAKLEDMARRETRRKSAVETAVGSAAARVTAMMGGGRDEEMLRVSKESKKLLREIRDKVGVPVFG